jgi:hypothetical protein
MSFSRKDLILLHKYKDDSYRKALVEYVVSLVKYEVFRSAMRGETVVRVCCTWANTKEEVESLAKEESTVKEQIQSTFKDSVVDIQIGIISLIFYSFWEIVINVNWG